MKDFKDSSSFHYITAEQDVGSWQILALRVERREFHASSSPSDMFLEDFPNKTEDTLVFTKTLLYLQKHYIMYCTRPTSYHKFHFLQTK